MSIMQEPPGLEPGGSRLTQRGARPMDVFDPCATAEPPAADAPSPMSGLRISGARLPLSTRSLQVLGGSPPGERLGVVLRIFSAIQISLIRTFPAVFALLAASPFLFLPVRRPAVLLVVGLAIAFLLTAALILPDDGGKQRGPRYLLVALPVIALACAWQLDSVIRYRRVRSKVAYGTVFVVLFCWGLVSNTYANPRHLARDYAKRIHPALVELRRHDPGQVVITHQYTAMELAAEHETRSFFLARSRGSLQKVASVLREKGVDEFLYVAFSGQLQPEGQISWQDDAVGRMVVHLGSMGIFGEYELFRGCIRVE